MERTICIYGNTVLRAKSLPVKDFTVDLKKLVDDMYETMYSADGVGLAAPQIGLSQSLCVVDSREGQSSKLVLVNPHIVSGEGEIMSQEGCLSVPEIHGEVKRYERIHVQAYDLSGNPLEFDTEGLLARVIQHEIDHLNGILFIDRLSPVKKVLLNSKLKKMKKKSSE